MSLRRRTLPADYFTIISNAWLRDQSLTWAARGLLAWIASHAAGYEITESVIIEAGPLGRDGVRAMVRELETAGYLHRERSFIPGGGSTVDYILSDPNDGEAGPPGDGGPVTSPDQPKQAKDPGEPGDGSSPPPSYREDQEKTKTPSVSKRTTATRVPEDFAPTEALRAWFVSEQLGQVIDGRIEHEKFMDYWRGCPGAKGRKHDWPATWRNWMRTAAERTPRRAGTALAPTSGAPQYQPSTGDKRLAQAQILFEKYAQMDKENDL